MRKQLDIPWIQLGIEGFAIIVSILLAFAIDAWWDALKEREEEFRLLTALSAEMADNASGAAMYAERKAEQAKSIRILIDALESVHLGESVQLSNSDLASAFSSGTYGVKRAVYDAMVQSGQLRLVENDDLKQWLAGWPAILEDAAENDVQVREVWAPKVIQRLISDVSVPQIFDSLACEPDDYQGRCANRESSVHSDTEVIGLLMMSHLYLLEAEREFAVLADYTNAISEIIAEELQSR